jgi:hypothetical protein
MLSKGDKIRRTTSLGEEVTPQPHVARFYGILKIPAEYDSDISSAKVVDISLQLPASLLGVSVATREL